MSEQPQPQFHAICIPDKADSLRMPEVISPLPQRILPEIPSNIQQGLANLELEASQLRNANMPSDSSVSSTGVEQMDSKQPLRSTTILRSGYEFTNEFFYRNLFDDSMRSKVNISARPSPFPKIKKNLPNLPLSDQEKGELLESVRPKVLKSTSPEVQLAWAQNALSWVEIETEHAIRSMSEAQLATSKSSRLESQLQKDAINIVLHLAEQSHPKAEFIRAYWFEFGKFGYQIDKKEAFLGYSRAAQNGFPRAQYRIGMQFENSNNPAKAIEHFCKGVAMKDSASHYRLGMMNLLGQHNTPIDYVRGINLLRFAAETADENSPQGSYVYGMLLARELPNVAIPDQYIPCDTISNARMFIEKAAYLGFAKAQLKMGLAYELCQLGCDFDPTLSVHYNALASRQGEPAAEMAISKWFLCGYEGIFEKNEELAFTYAQRAAATQFPMAEFAMGYFFEIGMYVASDLCLSEMWYKKAAEHGNQDALQRINSIKSNNVFSKKDHEQIALNRIKSRFGSQRGERPERLRRHQLSSAPIPDQEELDLQNSRISQVAMYPPNPQVYSIGRPDVVKPRNSYSGPYRSESGGDPNHISNNPASPSLLPPRSSSTRQIHSVPYPIDDTEITGHVPGPGQALNTGMHSDRPHSAFSIRPMTNTNAEVLTSHGRTQASYDQIRSSISMESMPPAGSQVTSVGDRIVPTGRETQLPDYRSTGPQMDANGQLYEYNRERPFPGKPQKPGTMNNNNKPQPPYQLDNYYTRQSAMNNLVRPERVSSANSPNPSQGAFRTPQRYPPQNMPSQQVIQPRNESRPNARPLPSAPVNSPSVATPVISPSATVSVTSPSAAAPKKAGPATFEEMGIPTANKEGECEILNLIATESAKMPPHKHKLEDEDEINCGSPLSFKISNDKVKNVKPRAEKKIKTEKPKKEKLDAKKIEALSTVGKDSKVRTVALQGDEATDLILNYLSEQNRPYSATEISANLHGKVAKSIADKLLREMSDSGKIKSNSTKGNEKGSQWVFWALQDAKDNASPEELRQMENKIQELKETISDMKIRLKAANKSLETIKSAPTTAELNLNIEALRAEIKLKKETLEGYKRGQINKLTRDEVMKVEKELKYWTLKRLARKRSFQNLEDLLLETKSREELWEEAGIEEDNYC